MLSDNAVLSLGADSDATFTHDGTTGLTIATPISVDSTGSLDLSSTTGDINFQDGGVNQLALDMDGIVGEVITQLKVDSDDFVFKQYDGTEVFRVEDNGDFDIAGGAGNSGVTITSAGQLTTDSRIIVDDTTNATNATNGSIQTDGGLSVTKDVFIGDELKVTGVTTVSDHIKIPSDKAIKLGNSYTGTIQYTSNKLQIKETSGDIEIKNTATPSKNITIDSNAGISIDSANVF